MSLLLNLADFPVTIGPSLIELSIGFLLTGVMIAQLYFYWDEYKNDPLWMKTLVYAVCIFESIQTALCLYTLWFYFVLSVVNPLNILQVPWTAGIVLFLEMTIAALAQGFNIYRIWQLSGRCAVVVFSAFMLFCRCASGFATGALTYRFNTLLTFTTTRTLIIIINLGLALAVAVDFLVAALLIYYLYKQRSSFKRTRHLIHTLMFYTVNTGALTMMFSLLALLTFNFVPHSTMSISFAIIVTKLYANSLLAMLNARRKIRHVNSDSGMMMSIPMQRKTSFLRKGHVVSVEDGVHIDISKESFPDDRSSVEPSDVSSKVTYSFV